MKKVLFLIVLFGFISGANAGFTQDLDKFKTYIGYNINDYINSMGHNDCQGITENKAFKTTYEESYKGFVEGLTARLNFYLMNFENISKEKDRLDKEYKQTQIDVKIAGDKYFAAQYDDLNYDLLVNNYHDLKKKLVSLQEEYNKVVANEVKINEDYKKDEIILYFTDNSKIKEKLDSIISEICQSKKKVETKTEKTPVKTETTTTETKPKNQALYDKLEQIESKKAGTLKKMIPQFEKIRDKQKNNKTKELIQDIINYINSKYTDTNNKIETGNSINIPKVEEKKVETKDKNAGIGLNQKFELDGMELEITGIEQYNELGSRKPKNSKFLMIKYTYKNIDNKYGYPGVFKLKLGEYLYDESIEVSVYGNNVYGYYGGGSKTVIEGTKRDSYTGFDLNDLDLSDSTLIIQGWTGGDKKIFIPLRNLLNK